MSRPLFCRGRHLRSPVPAGETTLLVLVVLLWLRRNPRWEGFLFYVWLLVYGVKSPRRTKGLGRRPDRWATSREVRAWTAGPASVLMRSRTDSAPEAERWWRCGAAPAPARVPTAVPRARGLTRRRRLQRRGPRRARLPADGFGAARGGHRRLRGRPRHLPRSPRRVGGRPLSAPAGDGGRRPPPSRTRRRARRRARLGGRGVRGGLRLVGRIGVLQPGVRVARPRGRERRGTGRRQWSDVDGRR